MKRAIFIRVNLPEKFIALSPGYQSHSLGISESDGSLWSWGANDYGQLGQENIAYTYILYTNKILGTHSFVQILLGMNFHWHLIQMDEFGLLEIVKMDALVWEPMKIPI